TQSELKRGALAGSLCPPRSGARSLPGGRGNFQTAPTTPPTPLRGGPFPPRSAPGDKAKSLSPTKWGKVSARRSASGAGEVGGNFQTAPTTPPTRLTAGPSPLAALRGDKG